MEGCPKALMINFDLKEISSIEEEAFAKPLSAYIQEYYNEDPKQYSKEIQQITQLRKGLSTIPRDKNGCNALRKYYTQLHYLQSRFPMASGGVASVPFIWHDIYSGEPCIYNDVRYEQACLLFNLGGLYSQLGANEGRLTDESMKVACTHFQHAAGVYTYIKDTFALSEMPDMTDEILALKVAVMLGQSLECILEKSIRDDKNQSLIARICMQVKTYFNEAIDFLNHNGTSEMGSYLRKSWVKHLKIKVHCYEALAYSYMSNDALKKEQYGQQVSYLKHANEQITEASKLLKNQSDRVVEMVNFIMDVVGNKYNAAAKDNDFIYHMTIPDLSGLEEIKPVNFVKPLPFTFDDATISGPDIFQKLIPLRAHEASSIYSEKKAEILRSVTASIQEKDMQMSGYMSALKIEDLIDPKDDAIPEELLAKNKFLQDNPDLLSKVEKDIEELAIKASKLDNLYKELRDKLQNEQEEQNNVEMPQELKVLFDELNTCEDAHLKASKTNNELVKHYNESKPMIQFLSGSPLSILQSLPSQNVVEAPSDEPIVQRIREILSKVDKMKNQRLKLLSQLRDELNKDDITALLAVRDQGDKESFFEEQIKKHDEKVGYINQNLAAQSNIIQALTEANAKYASTRERTSAISAQFDIKVKSYIAVVTLFLDVKDRIRSGLDFYKQLEDNVTLLETKINSYCGSQEKKRPRKPLGGSKAPPARPTARKPDIMKTAPIPPGQQIPFSNNTMIVDPRYMPQQLVDGKHLPPFNQGQQQFPVQPYPTPGAPQSSHHPHSPLQPSPFNLNHPQMPQHTIPPVSVDPAHSIHQVSLPEQRFPMQQIQGPPKQHVPPGTRFPSHPNPATANVGIPPQVNNSFNRPRQASQPNISTQESIGQNKHGNPLVPSQSNYNQHQYSGPSYNSKNNVQRLKQNYQPNTPSNPSSVVCHPHPPGALQHHPGTHPHAAATNFRPQQLHPQQGLSQQQQPGNLPRQFPPVHTLQQPSPISTSPHKVQVNAHQLPTQQQSTVVTQYSHPQQQQPIQSKFPSQTSTPQQPPANYQYLPKGVVQHQPIAQPRYPLQGGSQQAPQYPTQPTNQQQGLVPSQFPSQVPNQQQVPSQSQYPPNMQQTSVSQFPPPAMPNQQQIISQVPFPPHSSNQSQPTTNARFPSQPMGNQNQPQYPINNRQAQFGQQTPIQQTMLQQEQQRKQQQEQQLQQQQKLQLQQQKQQQQQQQQHPHQRQLQQQPQQQQPQHNYNKANQPQNYGQNQFRPQSGPPLPMQKNLPVQQSNVRFQQSYQSNVPNIHTQGYRRMGSETSPINDLLSDNNSLPLPLMPEKTGEQVDKSVNQILPTDDSSMIFPRSSANHSGMSNSPQHNSNVISTGQHVPQTKPPSQTPAYVKQESNELIYPRQHTQEHRVTSYETNRSYPSQEFVSNQEMVLIQTNQKPPSQGQAIIDRNLQVAIPSAPQNQISSVYEPRQVDYQNRISSPMPYSGPSITQSNSANHSGLLFASKPMMSPTMTPAHDPVISNILGKNIMPNMDITQIAQLNFQQIHIQSMVLQQQQLISMLQSQQNQQRSEEENKIHLMQQQISEQQKLIDRIKEQKEKDDRNVELQALLDYEKLIKKIHTEEQAKKEIENDDDDVKGSVKVSDVGSRGSLQRDSGSVVINPSSKCMPTSSSTILMPGMVNKDITNGNDNVEISSKSTAEGKSLIVNTSLLPDVLNLGKETSSNSSISSDVISDSVPTGNVTVNDHIPFYEPKLDIKVDDDDLSLILPRDMEENIAPTSNEDASATKKLVLDDDEDIIQPRSSDDNTQPCSDQIQPPSGDDNIQPHSGEDNIQPPSGGENIKPCSGDDNIQPRSGDNVLPSGGSIDVNLVEIESVGDKANIETKSMDSADSCPSASMYEVAPITPLKKDRKHLSDTSVFSSPSPSKKSTPNTSRSSSKMSTPNTSGRSSPALSCNSQGVQLDDIDNKERRISEAVDHRHLARQLGRMSFYVGGPEETVWLRYIQELDTAVAKLHTLCKNLCKRVENMDIDGFLKIWNDLAKVEELDVRNFSSSVGESNISKNRYRDILPWDHTRVKLSSTENDYINANSIQNLTPHSPHYIATQGPIPQTFSDFWTLVWEQKCQIIVMLTNEVEGTKLKCHHYWGREVDSRMEFDNLIIILMDEMTTSGWKIRTFTIVDKKSENTRMVKQFQFTSWPDYGTPESPYELLTFMDDIYQCHYQLDSTFESPIILHCSAGVGRTGSFCCIYSAIREMQGQNGLIDIPGVVRKLRQYRPHMVQRKEQLIFCYQAVLCFAQQFTVTEMHKISNPRYQDDMQLLMDISNEQNLHKKDTDTSSSKTGEPNSLPGSNLSNGTAENSINQFPMGATSRDYSQECELSSDIGGDNVSGNSKFKINSGIFQSTRTSCMDQCNASENLKSELE